MNPIYNNASISFTAGYHPFSGVLENVEIDLNTPMDEMMEEKQAEYNPMVGLFYISAEAEISCEGAEVKQNSDGKIYIDNYEELYASKNTDDVDKEQLSAILNAACNFKGEWHINEEGNGISCDVVNIQAKVLKACDSDIGVNIDVIDCCDAVSGDTLLLMENVLKLREHACLKHCPKDIFSIEDVGVLAIDDVTYEKSGEDVLVWIIKNISTIMKSYIPTKVYLVTLDREQAYFCVCEDTRRDIDSVFEANGFKGHAETNNLFKWVD